MDNIQGNDVKPPRSVTTDGTAVARMVESMATSPMLSITASRIGPRSLRSPTSARATRGAEEVVTCSQPVPTAGHSRPRDDGGRRRSGREREAEQPARPGDEPVRHRKDAEGVDDDRASQQTKQHHV